MKCYTELRVSYIKDCLSTYDAQYQFYTTYCTTYYTTNMTTNMTTYLTTYLITNHKK
ncbi:hypothetical protein [Leeuwenhoekiella nanhaiensis]|uniref:hypothetical protein n=1 Tax=Leeuwenhoekiella nanhaiensis TaxID=1655491 RepID=UPI0016701EFD|nr:hypothetical protein [Leeuwenhoekiella nanhaiensis]